MIKLHFINKNTGEELIGFEDEDFEYENPITHYAGFYIIRTMFFKGVPEDEMNKTTPPSDQSKEYFIEAVKEWNELLKDFRSIELPSYYHTLLETTKKADQVKLLKNSSLNPDILMALLIKATDLGYTLSQYSSEFDQKGLDLTKVPFAYLVKDDGTVEAFGETSLSDGQLRQAIEHRKVKVAKFLDKGDIWHCFFVTFKSLRGEETWENQGQPHYHYISNAFGISRSEVVKQIKSEKYNLGNLPHIKFSNDEN